MTKRTIQLVAVLCLAAGILTLVTAASIKRRAVDVRLDGVAADDLSHGQPDETAAAEPAGHAEAAEWMHEYTLTERSGRQFASQDLRGKVHVVSFFFASCPTICRLQNGRVKELAEEFGPAGVVFVSITVDPKRDTPAALQVYADSFAADPDHWQFLTSKDLTYLRRVGTEVYGLPTDEQIHSERLLVIDRAGEIRNRFHWNEPAEIAEMRILLRELLAQRAPPVETAAQLTDGEQTGDERTGAAATDDTPTGETE